MLFFVWSFFMTADISLLPLGLLTLSSWFYLIFVFVVYLKIVHLFVLISNYFWISSVSVMSPNSFIILLIFVISSFVFLFIYFFVCSGFIDFFHLLLSFQVIFCPFPRINQPWATQLGPLPSSLKEEGTVSWGLFHSSNLLARETPKTVQNGKVAQPCWLRLRLSSMGESPALGERKD